MVVVGGGLFGCWTALLLAHRGEEVVLIEQGDELLTRASWVNQARLHTGLHYPRSLLTAQEAMQSYQRFRRTFPLSIRDFTQIYAIARHGSKTSAAGFAKFIDRLGIDAHPEPVEKWFHPASVEAAWRVEEPSFDAQVLRSELAKQLAAQHRVSIRTGQPVVRAKADGGGVLVVLAGGEVIRGRGLVIATYAGINPLRDALGLEPLELSHELTEVLQGRVRAPLIGWGFTVMDGPFWAMMPFGHTDRVSLTSVGLTPVDRADAVPRFECQDRRRNCVPLALADCNHCRVRPDTLAAHHYQQMAMFLRDAGSFTYDKSLWTVKTVLRSTEVDDARPTLVRQEPDAPVWTVFSGKVSTMFELEETFG